MKKKSLDSTVIFIPKNKKKSQWVVIKKSYVFN